MVYTCSREITLIGIPAGATVFMVFLSPSSANAGM
jgi:hypothetical protein